MKVYVVFYDNGRSSEDHDINLDRIFLSEDSASKYVIDKNSNRGSSPSMTKEEYYSQDEKYISQSYEEWLYYETLDWDYYFYAEAEVFE